MEVKKRIGNGRMDKEERMGVYIKCPNCGEELNHDDEAYHLDKESGDCNVLSCSECEWVGNVFLEASFDRIEAKERR